MIPEDQNKQQYLDAAQRLVESLQRGETEQAERIVDELTRVRESALFRELGLLTRELHESLKAFRLDTRITELTAHEIPDARERLNYVITMTEQAATCTLNAIEQSMPAMETLGGKAQALRGEWARFRNRQMSVEEFRNLSREMEAFLSDAEELTGKVQSNLTEALMAQSFQDLTGQIIRRVVELVRAVHEGLGEYAGDDARPLQLDPRGHGPSVQGLDGPAATQDDANQLLSSLGL